ncbi:peptidase S26B signal peptidase [Clostridium sp. CAG:356]|nr:peptidase S26B signal peptidase [Clostridium sp. CAG:356]
MQKSKNITIAIIILILIYGLLANLKLVFNINAIYLYIINPLFWITLAVFLKIAIGKSYQKSRIKKEVIQYILIAVIVYILTYMISGLFITFGNNPYFTTVKGFLINLWMFGTVIISKEYIRYRLINNVYENDKKEIAILVSLIYIIIEIGLNKYINTKITLLFALKDICQNLIPLIAKNVLYSYISMKSDWKPASIYELFTKLYLWLSPILPNAPWIMVAIIETTIPTILFFYIRYANSKNSEIKSRQEIENVNPKNSIPLVVLVILVIWFTIGVFPIKPIAIASGSMEKELYVGDVVIVKKCNANDIVNGDIIQYQMKGYTVIHRVIEKKQKNGEYYFTTKGDNNPSEDKESVKEDQVLGKVIFKVKYLGYPSIWLNIIQSNEQVEVDTGK